MQMKLLDLKIKIFLLVITILLMDLLVIYILSDKSMQILRPYSFSQVFFDMWQRLTHFDITADRKIVLDEGFVVNGNVLAYNLPFPALVRGFLSIFGFGQSAILSVVMAVNIFSLASVFIFMTLSKVLQFHLNGTKLLRDSIVLVLITSSPILCMLAYPVTYWEAILWGIAMFMVCIGMSIRVLLDFKNKKLFIFFSFICGISLYTRPTILLGICLLFFLTWLKVIYKNLEIKAIKKSYFLSGLLLFTIFGLGVSLLNYFKWGSPFEFAPMKFYTLMWGPEQLSQFLQAGVARFDRIPESFAYYFFPSWDNFIFHFPFIKLGSSYYFEGFAKQFIYREETLPLSIALPVYLLLALMGIISFLRSFTTKEVGSYKNLKFIILPAAICSGIPALIMLPWFALSIRYMGEFLPVITFFSIYCLVLSLKWLDSLKMHQNTRFTMARISVGIVFIGLLAFISTYLAFSSSWLQHQGWNRRTAYYVAPRTIEPGGEIIFSKGGNGIQYLEGIGTHNIMGYGWAYPEAWGVWSEGSKAAITFWLPERQRPSKVSIKLNAILSQSYPQSIFDVLVNGKLDKTVLLTKNSDNIINIEIPKPDSTNPRTLDRVFIEFRMHDAKSPKSMGLGDDDRILGVGLISAQFN